MSKTFTTADIAKHKDDENGYWVIIETKVYDVTSNLSPLIPLGVEPRVQ